jgi:hypothetical protein
MFRIAPIAPLAVSACVLAAGLSTACASRQSPLMRSVMLLDTTAPPDSALVIFVRDSNPCDGGDPFRVVDDTGRFLGELIPSSKFSVRMATGHHAFFAWQPNGDLPRDLYPDVNQVGALEADFQPAKTYTVDVSITNATHGVRKTCFGYQFLALHFVDPTSPPVAAILDDATPFTPNAALGQAALEQDRKSVSEHIALGLQKLSR